MLANLTISTSASFHNLRHAGTDGLANGLPLPGQQATAQAVHLVLRVGCMAAFVANTRGDPERCLAFLRSHAPPITPVLYRLLSSNETLRKLVGCTPLAALLTACSARQYLVRLLQAAPQACLAAVDEETGWSVLHWAAVHGDTHAVAAVVEAVPAAVHAVDKDGNLPLLLACMAGHAAAVLLLLRAAPETATLRGYRGEQRPLDVALAWNHPEVVTVSSAPLVQLAESCCTLYLLRATPAGTPLRAVRSAAATHCQCPSTATVVHAPHPTLPPAALCTGPAGVRTQPSRSAEPVWHAATSHCSPLRPCRGPTCTAGCGPERSRCTAS